MDQVEDIEVGHLHEVVLDIEVDHLAVDQEVMMVVLVKVVSHHLEVDMLHVVMTMGVEDIEVDHLHEVVLDIEGHKVVEMEVIRLMEVRLVHVGMTMVEDIESLVQLNIVEMHLIMHTHNEVNNICISSYVHYNLRTQILDSLFLCQKNSSSNIPKKPFMLQSNNLGSKKLNHFPL